MAMLLAGSAHITTKGGSGILPSATIHELNLAHAVMQDTRRTLKGFCHRIGSSAGTAMLAVREPETVQRQIPGTRDRTPPSAKPVPDGYYIVEVPADFNSRAKLHGPVNAETASQALALHLHSLGILPSKYSIQSCGNDTQATASPLPDANMKLSYEATTGKKQGLDLLLLSQHKSNMRFQKATCYTYRPEPPPPPKPARTANSGSSSTSSSGARDMWGKLSFEEHHRRADAFYADYASGNRCALRRLFHLSRQPDHRTVLGRVALGCWVV